MSLTSMQLRTRPQLGLSDVDEVRSTILRNNTPHTVLCTESRSIYPWILPILRVRSTPYHKTPTPVKHGDRNGGRAHVDFAADGARRGPTEQHCWNRVLCEDRSGSQRVGTPCLKP